MGRAMQFVAIAVASCVAAVHGVPLLAQADSGARAMLALDRTAVGAAREYVDIERVQVVPAVVPRNLVVPRVYQPLLESMLERSPTFRRQCQRIANASLLIVTVEVAASPAPRASRAETHIVRQNGRLTATVVINQVAAMEELIAHEVEHIIEQLDGIDLASKAMLRHSGVETLDHNGVVFETVRARHVGLKVADEVRRPLQARASFVW